MAFFDMSKSNISVLQIAVWRLVRSKGTPFAPSCRLCKRRELVALVTRTSMYLVLANSIPNVAKIKDGNYFKRETCKVKIKIAVCDSDKDVYATI